MFLNVVRQQIPQQVPLTQSHHIGRRQAGPDDLIQQFAADPGYHGPLVAAEGGGQIGLHHLLEGRGIRRARVNAFHMDEYIGLNEDHPAGFRNFLRRAIFDRLPLGRVYLLNGGAKDAQAAAREYEELLRAHPLDLCLCGIGENGHLAFNDPPVADFEDRALVKIVELDGTCRMQQVLSLIHI